MVTTDGHTARIAEGAISSIDDAAASVHWSPGDAFGPYVVRRELGRGGMGEVIAAYDPRLDREVAIKLLRFTGASLTAAREARARLQQEAQALARLSHPNVVAVYDVHHHDEDLAVVMELIHGVTLKQWMTQKRPWRQVVKVVLEAGRGLAAAHAAGIVHRDFKPANVVIDESGRARVLDFGLARVGATEMMTASSHGDPLLSNPELDGLTSTGHVLGTPRYMAPEQHRAGATDERTDQFAFCVTLYEAVYGKHPFRGDNYVLLRDAVLAGDCTPPPKASVPRALWKILKRGLQRDPEQRYPSMAVLLADIERMQTRSRKTGAAVLLAVASSPLSLLASSSETEQCSADEELQQRWDREWGPNVRAAFEGVGGSFGQSQWLRAELSLRDYVSRWRHSYQTSCAIGTAEDAARRDQTMLCLRSLQRKLEASVAVLREADHTTILRASEIVQGLPEPGRCEHDATRVDYTEAGSDEAWAGQVALVEALLAAGQYAKAVPRVEALMRETDDDDLARRARVVELQGMLQAHLHSERAVATLEEAAALAHALGNDRAVARVSVMLAEHLGAGLRDFERAEVWARHGFAALERVGDEPQTRGKLLNAVGAMREYQARFEEAHASYRGALAAVGEDSGLSVAAKAVTNIANTLYHLEQWNEAEAAYRRAHDLSVRLLGADHPDTAMPLNGLGNVYMVRGNAVEAASHYQRVLQLFEHAYGKEHPKLVIPLANLAHVARMNNRCEAALPMFGRALEIQRSTLPPNHPDLAKTLGGLASTYQCLEQWQACVEHGEQALAISGIHDFHSGRRATTVIECLLARGDGRLALQYAQRLLETEENVLGRDHPRIWDALDRMARALILLDRPTEAVAVLRRALGLPLSPTRKAASSFNLARALWLQRPGDPEALELATAARASYREAGHAHKVKLIEAWLADPSHTVR